ncbi:hypothetical protein E2C01_043822 [Portunus trituberculatus]|uniref:Uncharacterized protein n=1 Tax=Portunus trituberculatus TaxID=210409 RepID=A0A5B7G0J6_PORTR|nr:hypothetical protein [Portunus trituberculatus]
MQDGTPKRVVVIQPPLSAAAAATGPPDARRPAVPLVVAPPAAGPSHPPFCLSPAAAPRHSHHLLLAATPRRDAKLLPVAASPCQATSLLFTTPLAAATLRCLHTLGVSPAATAFPLLARCLTMPSHRHTLPGCSSSDASRLSNDIRHHAKCAHNTCGEATE